MSDVKVPPMMLVQMMRWYAGALRLPPKDHSDDYMASLLDDACDAIMDATKRAEAAEGDAARYRWLKERLVEDCDDYDHYLSTREVFSEELVKTFSKDRWGNFLKRTELDAAIDAARAAQEQQK